MIRLLYQASDVPVVSISQAQRYPVARANWIGSVPHGLPIDLLQPQLKPGKYLAFLGRMCQDKRPDAAIRLARILGQPIRLAAKVDKGDQEYFDTVIRPLLTGPNVEFIGEISASQKASFLGDASALLFPIDWPEPFGLVMIEAMACGTPVIAMRRGSVLEIIRDGVSGYVVNSEMEFLAAIDHVGECSRAGVRQEFETRFTSRRMAQDYVRIYERLLKQTATKASQDWRDRIAIGNMRPRQTDNPSVATAWWRTLSCRSLLVHRAVRKYVKSGPAANAKQRAQPREVFGQQRCHRGWAAQPVRRSNGKFPAHDCIRRPGMRHCAAWSVDSPKFPAGPHLGRDNSRRGMADLSALCRGVPKATHGDSSRGIVHTIHRPCRSAAPCLCGTAGVSASQVPECRVAVLRPAS